MAQRDTETTAEAGQRRFEGQIAIVTGGSAGIGLSCILHLLNEGAKVCYTGLPADAGKAAALIEAAGHHPSNDTLELTGNMANDDFCKQVVEQAVSTFGKVDVLVNNAFSFNAKGIDGGRVRSPPSSTVGPSPRILERRVMLKGLGPWLVSPERFADQLCSRPRTGRLGADHVGGPCCVCSDDPTGCR